MLYVMNSEYTLVQRNLVYMTKFMHADGVSYLREHYLIITKVQLDF